MEDFDYAVRSHNDDDRLSVSVQCKLLLYVTFYLNICELLNIVQTTAKYHGPTYRQHTSPFLLAIQVVASS